MLIGYLRAHHGNAQRQALAEAGCEQVVEERPAADDGGEEPEFRGLLARLRPGDVVAVARLGSLGRSLPEVVRRAQQLAVAGAALRSLAEALDMAAESPDGAAQADVDGLPVRDDRRGEHLWDAADRPSAATRRRAGGRPPKLSPEQQAAVADEVLSGRRTAAAMARRYRVSDATISRLLAAQRANTADPSSRGQAGGDAGAADRVAGVLPVSALDGRLAIVGTSGSGKTYAAKGLLERVMTNGGRVCVVDPLGVWWGLRAGVEGAAPPFPVVVFGGAHACVPLAPGMGAALGRLIATQPMACVVDVSDFASASARRCFMTAFAEALYGVNTEPLHLVLDEADLWAPQRAQPDGAELLGRVEEIVRRGRVRGFVPWLITQRPAVLHKDVLSQADTLVSMKLTSSQDRAAVGRWIEGQADRAEGRRILGALPRLRRGEGWVWAPSDGVLARVAFPRIRTFDSSQTPRRAEHPGAPRALAPVDLSAIGRVLAGMASEDMALEAGDEGQDALTPGSGRASDLVHRLRQRDAELAAARTQLARVEAEAAAVRARSASPLRPEAGT